MYHSLSSPEFRFRQSRFRGNRRDSYDTTRQDRYQEGREEFGDGTLCLWKRDLNSPLSVNEDVRDGLLDTLRRVRRGEN